VLGGARRSHAKGSDRGVQGRVGGNQSLRVVVANAFKPVLLATPTGRLTSSGFARSAASLAEYASRDRSEPRAGPPPPRGECARRRPVAGRSSIQRRLQTLQGFSHRLPLTPRLLREVVLDRCCPVSGVRARSVPRSLVDGLAQGGGTLHPARGGSASNGMPLSRGPITRTLGGK